MGEWATHTPDGRRLQVRRENETWIASCGEAQEARNELLDVALIEAIRQDHAVVRPFASGRVRRLDPDTSRSDRTRLLAAVTGSDSARYDSRLERI
jgi:hypothetical protein